jgi:hypothetical protein
MSATLDSLGALSAAIDALLENSPLPASDAELHDFMVGLIRERNRLVAACAPALAAWERRRVWEADGSRSPAARLARATGSAQPTAKRELARARHLAEMPATAAALAEGRLTVDHVDALSRAKTPARAARFAEHEATLVEQCERLDFAPAQRVIDYWCQRADAEIDSDDARDRSDDSRLFVSATTGGRVAINGTLDPIGGEIFRNELDRIEREIWQADQRSGNVRTPAQRRALALVEMATRSATAPADGRRPKPLFTVHVGRRAISASLPAAPSSRRRNSHGGSTTRSTRASCSTARPLSSRCRNSDRSPEPSVAPSRRGIVIVSTPAVVTCLQTSATSTTSRPGPKVAPRISSTGDCSARRTIGTGTSTTTMQFRYLCVASIASQPFVPVFGGRIYGNASATTPVSTRQTDRGA